MDINHDLKFLCQNWRVPSSYDMLFGGPPPLWGQAPPFAHRSGLGTPGELPSLGRPMDMGLSPSNGIILSAIQNQAAVGPPQPNLTLQHHSLAYKQFPGVPSYGGPRLRDVYTYGPRGPASDSYLGYSGHSTWNHPSPSSTPNMIGASTLGYPAEHEMGLMPSGGHHNPPFFGHANPGPPPTFPPSSSHGNGSKGISNGCHSLPSPLHLANGMPSSKSNRGWMNPNMGMGSFQIGSTNGKGGDQDARMVHNDDERDRLVAKDRERKRAE